MDNKLSGAQIKGQIWKRRIHGAQSRKKLFSDTGHEIWRYGYSKDHHFDYQKTLNNSEFKAKVSKTSEAIQIFVPLINPPNPRRLVHPRAWDTPEAKARCKAREAWINYTPGKTGLSDECRSISTDAIVYGRGVAWTGVHPRKGLTASQWCSVKDLILDGNATSYDQITWGGRRRVMPRYELIDLVSQAGGDVSEVRRLKATGRRQGDKSESDDENQDASTDCIEIFDLYSNIGLHNDRDGIELVREQAKAAGLPVDDQSVQAAMIELEEQPLRYLVTREGQLIAEMPWEIPFYEMDEWPWTVEDFYPNPGSVWPVSPLAGGLCYQRAMNYITTILMGRAKFDFRTIYAMLDQNRSGLSEADKLKVLHGPDIQAMKIDAQGDSKNINDFIQQWNSDKGHIGAGLTLLDYFGAQYDKATGLYSILFAGEGNTQSRTAQDASIKDRNSRSRIEDMRDQVAKFHSGLGRKEAFAASFLFRPEQIGPVLGPENAAAWGQLVTPEVKADPMLLATQYLRQGMDPQSAMQATQQAVPLMYTLEDLALEAEYTIEVSSSRRHDIDQQIDAIKEVGQTLWPVLFASQDPMERAMAYRSYATLPRLSGLEEAAQQAEQMAQYWEGIAMQQQQQMAMQAQMGMPPQEAGMEQPQDQGQLAPTGIN